MRILGIKDSKVWKRDTPREREKAKGRRRLGLEKIKPSDGTDTCVVVIKERGREERESGLSPIGERVETLTLPLKLERGGQTCPAWTRWSHMQDLVGP